MLKIDIISGFLGAGKTTLIKKLLSSALKGQKIVLIENEFGDIGIDGGFLKESGIQINEMNSGCICCSLVGDFKKALNQVYEQYAPDRIIIEPSGVGKFRRNGAWNMTAVLLGCFFLVAVILPLLRLFAGCLQADFSKIFANPDRKSVV